MSERSPGRSCPGEPDAGLPSEGSTLTCRHLEDGQLPRPLALKNLTSRSLIVGRNLHRDRLALWRAARCGWRREFSTTRSKVYVAWPLATHPGWLPQRELELLWPAGGT